MVTTAQEILERRKLFADVKAKEKIETRKVRKEKASGFVRAGFKPLSKKQQQTGKGFSRVARKAISLASPKEGFVKAMTTDSDKKSGRGRGRPSGTYKVRYLPSGRAVKVPTHIYKKMLSAEKTQIRLARAQRLQAAQQMADQVAMQQDPRFQPGSEEQFLAEPDQQHETDVAMAKAGYPIQVQDGPRFGGQVQRAGGIISQIGRGVSNLGGVRRTQPQQIDQYGRPIEQQPQFAQAQGQQTIVREPQVSLFSPQPNILNAPNIFNNPGQAELIPQIRRKKS